MLLGVVRARKEVVFLPSHFMVCFPDILAMGKFAGTLDLRLRAGTDLEPGTVS